MTDQRTGPDAAQMPEGLRAILAEPGWELTNPRYMPPGEVGWDRWEREGGEHSRVHVRQWTDGQIRYYVESMWLGNGNDSAWHRAVALADRIERALSAGDGAEGEQ